MIDNRGRQTDVLRKKQREFRSGIIKQIYEKQEERVNERRARYQEGVKLEEEAKARRQKLEEAKIRKLNELRFVCSTLTLIYTYDGPTYIDYRIQRYYFLGLNLEPTEVGFFGWCGQPCKKPRQ